MGRNIINGDPDTTQAHQAVVYIQLDMGGGYAAGCTGTLVAPDVILTAGHCVSNEYGSLLSTSALDVFFGNSTSYGGFYASRSVSERLRHPAYDHNWNNGAPSNDIALLRLSSAAPSTVTPIPHLPGSLGITSSDVGAELNYVGFGVQENGTSGVKEYVYNDLDQVCTYSSGCSYGGGGLAAPHTICSDQSPGGPCSGDSGGPAFLFRSGQEYVVGVTSYGDQNCQYYGCSAQVDYYESFIADFMGGVNGSSCSSDANCDSGLCVDGVCCNSNCTGVCQACNVAGHLGTCSPRTNGTACADNDKCNGTETCQNGVCSPGSPPNCDDGNFCTRDSCYSGTGCQSSPVSDGIPCQDGNICNGDESCQAGVCRSSGMLDCDDFNPCTRDSCDNQMGCINSPRTDGVSCEAGRCGDGVCQAGVCMGGQEALCDDHEPCTEDMCDPDVGCFNSPRPDGYACGDCLMCQNATCVPANNCKTDDCDCSAGTGAGGRSSLMLVLLGLLVFRFRRR